MKLLILFALVAIAAAAPKALPKPGFGRVSASMVATGKYQFEDRIVGGVEVVPHSLPFQVSVQRLSGGVWRQSCGGSIFDRTHVICAAHCVDDIRDLTNPGVNIRVLAGAHNNQIEETSQQARFLSRVDYHAGWASSVFANDVSILRLAQPLDWTPEVQPIRLPVHLHEPPVGQDLITSGWGTTSSSGSISAVLRSVVVPVVSDADCDAAYTQYKVYDHMICAGRLGVGGVDSCQGDSGGPLFNGTSPNFELQGIVSWGVGCADPRYPGVYTQVSHFVPWITAIVTRP